MQVIINYHWHHSIQFKLRRTLKLVRDSIAKKLAFLYIIINITFYRGYQKKFSKNADIRILLQFSLSWFLLLFLLLNFFCIFFNAILYWKFRDFFFNLKDLLEFLNCNLQFEQINQCRFSWSIYEGSYAFVNLPSNMWCRILLVHSWVKYTFTYNFLKNWKIGQLFFRHM